MDKIVFLNTIKSQTKEIISQIWNSSDTQPLLYFTQSYLYTCKGW